MKRFENLLGKRFGSLTVVDLKIDTQATSGRYKRVWICRCTCGNTIEVRRPDALKCGDIKSCGCYSKKTIVKAIKVHTLPKGEAAFNALYSDYKKEAVQRDLIFQLDEIQFRKITSSRCFYCNEVPSQTYKVSNNGKYMYNGIDRMDNSIGYIKYNCVPCCKMCNFIKGGLSKEDFLLHINGIHSYIKNGVSIFNPPRKKIFR